MPVGVYERPSLKERFLDKISPEPMSGCWLWTGGTNDREYGNIRVEGITKKAHRVSYELFVGPIPKGLSLDHLCRVHSCVNPDHLEPVTHKENMRRGNGDYNRHKTHCPQGHEYSVENTYHEKKGRSCRECNRVKARRFYAKQRALS